MSSGDVELDDRSHTRRLILLLTTLVVLPGILFTLWVVRANPNPDPTTDPASATSPLVNALALNVGDCLNSGALDDPNLVLPAPCTLQHDATVFANASLTTADVSTDESSGQPPTESVRQPSPRVRLKMPR